MKRVLAVVLAPLALAVSLVAPPAQAAGATITIADGVLYECTDYPFDYAVDLPPGTDSFALDATAWRPDGLRVGSEFIPDGPRSGVGSFYLCPSDLAGPYMITGVVRAYDNNDNETSYALPITIFRMRQPLTSTVARATKDARPGQTINVRVKTLEERPAGFFPNAYASVYLEQRVRGEGWQRLKRAKTTTDGNGRGKTAVKFTGGQMVLRAVHPGSRDEPGSTSSIIKVH